MTDDMGTFRVDMEIENPARPGARRLVSGVLVDTGSQMSWIPSGVLESLGIAQNNKESFRQADGTILERWTGTVVSRVGGKGVGDEVVFGLAGDMALLGARTLEGLNLRIDSRNRRLVDAGPAPAAAAA